MSKLSTLRTTRLASAGFTLVELLVVIAIIGILVALLLPAVQAARESARRTQCTNHFHQVAVAFHNHHSARNKFPAGVDLYWNGGCPTWPPATTGSQYYGWGWGVYLLPYLEEQVAYSNINFKTNDHAAVGAREAAGALVESYICPSDGNNGAWVICCSNFNNGPGPNDDFRMTNIAGVADSRDMGCMGNKLAVKNNSNGVLYNIKKTKMSDITDGSSHTLLIGEVTGAEGIGSGASSGPAYYGYFWVAHDVQDMAQGLNGPLTVPGGRSSADPIDGDGGSTFQELFSEIGFSSWHKGGVNFAYADGSVHFFSDNIDQKVLEDLSTRAGGESFASDGY
jgi:prepilin-type N-terminal cleavage/methylation domain-containing protein/prepilin-type processing-associated H-X9-DG protein